jgi:hypothetical protein
MPPAQEEMHDAGFQGYQPAYLDPAQAQALANYIPEFAGMDPASQAAAMQHYAQLPAQQVAGPTTQQVAQSETESDMEEGVDAGARLPRPQAPAGPPRYGT